MLEGLKQHELFLANFKRAKQNALTAGFFFLSASSCFQQGEWLGYLGSFAGKLATRTIQRYAQFAEEAVEWARKQDPKLKGDKLQAAALDMVMQSPKGYVALCRQLRLMRKFGDYDEVKYAARKLAVPGQLELEFGDVIKWLEPLEHFGDSNFRLVPPEGKSERQCLEELDARFEAIRTRVRAQLQGMIDT